MSSTLREAIQQVILELLGPMPASARGLLNVGPQGQSKATPPPLPKAAQQAQKPASAALPQNNALGKFKSSLNMAADAGARAKQASEAANTKEALRWLDKMIEYATAAKKTLGA
jgi:hypothetical protein